jgi:hypothetical protein
VRLLDRAKSGVIVPEAVPSRPASDAAVSRTKLELRDCRLLGSVLCRIN